MPKVVELMPLQAQELGFLEIRRQALELRDLGSQDISEVYNLEFLKSTKIWIQTA